MDKSQWYIGSENGVVICVDRIEDSELKGRMFHSYNSREVSFENTDDLIFSMFYLFEYLQFPRNATTLRIFGTEVRERPARRVSDHTGKDRKKIMTDKELLEQHGSVETFIVRVQRRQNSTWQGRITWAKEDKTVNFRSIWEMIHLMESAIYKDADPESLPEIHVWEDTEEED